MNRDILHPVIRHEDVVRVAAAAKDPADAMAMMERLRLSVLESTGAPDCILVSSCTQALRVCFRVLCGFGPVVVPDLTFVATAHAALASGKAVRLVDVDPNTLHMSKPGASEWPDSASAVAPVELLGRPISSGLASDLADFGAPIIVDAAQSLGATRWRKVYTAMCVSFAANKIVHGHQGGAILCSTEDGARIRK